jgi:hypothetical protein
VETRPPVGGPLRANAQRAQRHDLSSALRNGHDEQRQSFQARSPLSHPWEGSTTSQTQLRAPLADPETRVTLAPVPEQTAKLYASRGWYFLSTYSDRQAAAYKCFVKALELPDPSGEQHERALRGIERLGEAKPQPPRSSRSSRAVERWPRTQTYVRNGVVVTRRHAYAGQETRASRIRRIGY